VEKYFFKTDSAGKPAEECNSSENPSKGTMIGSINCKKYCNNNIGSDDEEKWVKCLNIEVATKKPRK
jgi:hypothetical protein